MSGRCVPKESQRIRGQSAVLHVDFDADVARLCPVEDPVQVGHARVAVDRLPKLGQLDGDRGIQTAVGDRTGCFLVLLDGVGCARQVGDPLTE
jgi:hypothetical protein